jgi:hypothetical protein
MKVDGNGTNRMHGDRICTGNFNLIENLKGRNHLGELGVDKRMLK